MTDANKEAELPKIKEDKNQNENGNGKDKTPLKQNNEQNGDQKSTGKKLNLPTN